MEPFLIRCETCHARLKVREERFLGQVQSCPKCGSMVHIIAPVVEATPDHDGFIAAAATASVGARLVWMVREHAVLWSVGAAIFVVSSGMLAVLALRTSDESAPISASTPVSVSPPETNSAENEVVRPVEKLVSPAPEVVKRGPTRPLPEVVTEIRSAELEPIDVAALAPQPAAQPAVEPAQPAMKPTAEKPRTLTLEPVAETAKRAAPAATQNYPPAEEVESTETEAKTPAVAARARVTNLKDQLAIPIESIDMPAMPIGEFVSFVSGMTAVRIQLDAKVLSEVGLSTRSTVVVRGEDTTAGRLLALVLKEHQLTCIERDGELIVVRAKR